MKAAKIISLCSLLILLVLACKKNEPQIDIEYIYKIPDQIDDGWEVSSLTETGMNETPIVEFMNELLNNIDHKIHSILIIKNGKLVFEEYFTGYDFYHGPLTNFNREVKHDLASVTKSFTSTLTGLCIDKGFIQDVNQKVFSFFPEYADLNNAEKDKITIEHLLTMTSGLLWDESTYPYTDQRNDLYQLIHHDDPIRFILSKPVVTEPGNEFLYSGGSTNVLGEIIRKASGSRADSIAEQYLFSPLEISDNKWTVLPNNILYTSGDLKLRPRDMAKLGDVFLHDGKWNDNQIISKDWIENSTKFFIPVNSEYDYGYKWWLHTYEFDNEMIESFSARGWGGQNIIVFPSLDMLVTTTAGYYDDPQTQFQIDVLLISTILNSAL